MGISVDIQTNYTFNFNGYKAKIKIGVVDTFTKRHGSSIAGIQPNTQITARQ